MDFAIARRKLLDQVLIPSGIHDRRLLRIMGELPRHRFVEEAFASQAYSDNSLPIGFNQTISKPTIVAQMLQALALKREEKVLEVGTGSGYQTALLSRLVRNVCTVDVVESFVLRTKRILAELECYNVSFQVVSDQVGFPSEAPFDAIVVSACMNKIPAGLIEQLHPEGGRLVAPVRRGREQRVHYIVRNQERLTEVDLGRCQFVPFVA